MGKRGEEEGIEGRSILGKVLLVGGEQSCQWTDLSGSRRVITTREIACRLPPTAVPHHLPVTSRNLTQCSADEDTMPP